MFNANYLTRVELNTTRREDYKGDLIERGREITRIFIKNQVIEDKKFLRASQVSLL